MSNNNLSTDSYKGVRDFYPEDAAIQQYIFSTWARTAESFGFERYDASILEPSDLYKAKGAENEEMVNEQTYTFIDRGDREVTLRPEMTPTVARMVAGRARALSFPLRWYSIPNLFRYERMQKGRLREHWQLNCDMFGTTDYTADVEVIALAYQTLIDFGAKPEMFEIRVNNRRIFPETVQYFAKQIGVIISEDQITQMVRLMDREGKMPKGEFNEKFDAIAGKEVASLIEAELKKSLDDETRAYQANNESFQSLLNIKHGLKELGIEVKFDPKLMRGFDYYTGTIFEIFDVSGENNRSLLGGGRYDNLTGMFGGEPISGIGFGMGDVTMRDFLETHNLLTYKRSKQIFDLLIIPSDKNYYLDAQKIAYEFRKNGISCYVDISDRKINKKLDSYFKNLNTKESNTRSMIVFGEDEIKSRKIKKQDKYLTVKQFAKYLIKTRKEADISLKYFSS